MPFPFRPKKKKKKKKIRGKVINTKSKMICKGIVCNKWLEVVY